MKENLRQRRMGATAALALVAALAACTTPQADHDAVPHLPEMQSADRDGQIRAAQEQAEDLFHDRFPNDPLPDASLVRAVAPSEWSETIATCMTEAGFESHVKGGAVETTSYPVEQALAQGTAVYQCRVSYPIDPVYQQPYTAEETEYMYRYLVDTVVPCLEGEGYSVDNVPSAGTFEDQLSSGQEWSPLDALAPGSEEKYTSLMKTCPDKPAGFRGY